MIGESGTSRTMKVHHYYKCATAKKHRACKKKPAKKVSIEDIVVNQAARLLEDESLLERIADYIAAHMCGDVRFASLLISPTRTRYAELLVGF